MRRVLILLPLLLACGPAARATVAGCEYILQPHLNFSFCYNHCRRSDTAVFRYVGLMEALNAHIERRISEGKLTDKKFEIIFVDLIADSGMPVTELSQNRRGYHVTSRHEADLNLAHLVRIVDYFASKSWRPFDCCSSWTEPLPDDEQRKRLRRILDSGVGPPHLSRFAGRRSTVLELGDLQMVYEDDRLSYWLAGRKLDLQPGDPRPVRVGDRYLLGSETFFHVYENGVEIRRYPKPDLWKDWGCTGGPILARAHRTWINLGCGDVRLTYSFEQNRFHEVASGKEEFRRARCSDEPGGGEVHPLPVRVVGPP